MYLKAATRLIINYFHHKKKISVMIISDIIIYVTCHTISDIVEVLAKHMVVIILQYRVYQIKTLHTFRLY